MTGFLHDRLGRAAAWLATIPARRLIFGRHDAEPREVFSEDGVRLSGWLFQVPDARGTVVLGHGYRDDRRQLTDLVAPLAARRFRTLAFDFRAHGKSEGDRITIGIDESKDVRSVLDHAQRLGGPVYYIGFSMGAAAYLLSGREAHAAVLDSPYDTLRRAVDVRLSKFRVPRAMGEAVLRHGARRLLSDESDTVDRVRPVDIVPRLTRPTLMIFARGDGWVGAEARARYRAALSPSCALEEVEGDHSDHFTDGWLDRVATFIENAAG